MDDCITKLQLRTLGDKLINLSSEGKAFMELRSYQGDLKNVIDTQIESLNKLQRFVAFFLDLFIDDYFYNLAGDYPYRKDLEKTYLKIWREILNSIGYSLLEIAENIEENNYSECCEACASIVSLYLEKINYLNKILMEDKN